MTYNVGDMFLTTGDYHMVVVEPFSKNPSDGYTCAKVRPVMGFVELVSKGEGAYIFKELIGGGYVYTERLDNFNPVSFEDISYD